MRPATCGVDGARQIVYMVLILLGAAKVPRYRPNGGPDDLWTALWISLELSIASDPPLDEQPTRRGLRGAARATSGVRVGAAFHVKHAVAAVNPVSAAGKFCAATTLFARRKRDIGS